MQGKKRVGGESGPLPLQSAGPPQFTARKTRIRIPGYNNEGEHSKTWALRAKFSIVFSVRGSVVTSWTHEGWTLVQQLDLHDILIPFALPASESWTGSHVHTLCTQLDSSPSDLLLQKCWVQWKLLRITLKNGDIGGKRIRHLLNQDQPTRLCGAFFLISMKTKSKLHKLENRWPSVLTALRLSFGEYGHI